MVGVGETLSDRADSDPGDRSTWRSAGACNDLRASEEHAHGNIVPNSLYGRTDHHSGHAPCAPGQAHPCIIGHRGGQRADPQIGRWCQCDNIDRPPKKGLAGVAQHELDIDNGERSAENVEEMLENIGAKAATPSEYKNFVDSCKRNIMSEGGAK